MSDMNEGKHDRPIWMLGLIALSLASLVAIRFWAPKPLISGGVPVGALGTVKIGGEWNAPGNQIFVTDLVVELGAPQVFKFLDISLDNNDTYRLDIATERGFLPFHTIYPAGGYGLARREVRFSQSIGPTTHLRVVAVSGDGLYSLGHLIVR